MKCDITILVVSYLSLQFKCYDKDENKETKRDDMTWTEQSVNW